MDRRRFLAGAGATGAAVAFGTWTPVGQIAASSLGSTRPRPPAFPSHVHLYQQAYRNWSGEIRADGVWTCSAATPDDVVAVANWAHAHGWTVRPRGSMHGWTPLTIVAGSPLEHVVLVDTTAHLTDIVVRRGNPGTVTCGAGALIGSVLQALQDRGLGWDSVPAPGSITIAGALAVDAHGAALPGRGEELTPGSTYGSLSNLVTAITAVVWDDGTQRYGLRTFARAEPAIRPLLTHLGRSFVTSVSLQAGDNARLRCQSRLDIGVDELFGRPGAGGRTFGSVVAEAGRAEAIWFPFTDRPWLKVWTRAPHKPAASRAVRTPFNYTFSDNIDLAAADAVSRLPLDRPSSTPEWGGIQLDAVRSGLPATNSADIWGWSKDTLLYIRPTTIRMTEGGGAVITARSNIQSVVHEFTEWYQRRLSQHRARGRFPINGPVEIRCCGLDRDGDVQVRSAGGPMLSALRVHPRHPDWDTAIWLNVLSLPGTKGMWSFYREMEGWMMATFSGARAQFRPEWSKGWAFSDTGPYRDPRRLTATIPSIYRSGLRADDGWDQAVAQLDAFDPGRVFSNPFIDRLMRGAR